MRRGGRALALAAAAGLVAAAACTDVPTDPTLVTSIVAETIPVPSLFVGDTLRDTAGAPIRLTAFARAFNPQGGEIAAPPVSIFVRAADTASHGTPAARVVYAADSTLLLIAGADFITPTSAVSLSLQFAKGLRVNQRFEIVPRPSAIARDTSTSAEVRFSDLTTTSGTATFAALVTYDSAPGATGRVRSVLVSFLTDTGHRATRVDSVRFTDAAPRNSEARVRIDTTDARGVASRSLTVYRHAGAAAGTVARDTLRVTAAVHVGRDVRTVVLQVPVVDSVVTTP